MTNRYETPRIDFSAWIQIKGFVPDDGTMPEIIGEGSGWKDLAAQVVPMSQEERKIIQRQTEEIGRPVYACRDNDSRPYLILYDIEGTPGALIPPHHFQIVMLPAKEEAE